MGESREISNMGCESGKSKQLAKGNREEMPHESNSNCHEGGTQWLWVCLCVYPYVLYFCPLKHFTTSLLSIFVGIFFCKAKGPGPFSLTTGLVGRIRCFHCRNLTSTSGWNPSPAPSHCRLRPPEIQSVSQEMGSKEKELFTAQQRKWWTTVSGEARKS